MNKLYEPKLRVIRLDAFHFRQVYANNAFFDFSFLGFVIGVDVFHAPDYGHLSMDVSDSKKLNRH